MILYDGPRYTTSDWAKYLVIVGLGFVGFSLVVLSSFRAIAVFVCVSLFWLGVFGLILIAVLGRWYSV